MANCRPGPAAVALGVHVNALYQRLTTIDRVLGERWREPDQALELQLLFQLKAGGDALPSIGC
jgi:DNA-binding PucR family transcriptional regulator